jgi:hypothetical protein
MCEAGTPCAVAMAVVANTKLDTQLKCLLLLLEMVKVKHNARYRERL